MTEKQISQWRTVGVAVFGCVLLVVAFITIAVLATPKDGVLALPDVARLFDALTDAVVWLIAAVALKASVEHLGRGSGVRGAVRALLTDTQPGGGAPPAGGTP